MNIRFPLDQNQPSLMLLMAYFRAEAEALHLALSEDGICWQPLNDNAPVYQSPVGTRTVRDPFILRSEDGQFHLLSTNGWRSNDIVHAISDDLVTWRDIQLVPVMASVTGTLNCWAPKAFFDAESRIYRIIWSSTTPLSEGPMDAHGYNHRIWSVSTEDFRTFSSPRVFFDPGYNVIDATVACRPEGGYLMAFKDERTDFEAGAPHKAIRVARANCAQGPWEIREAFVSPNMTEGPALFLWENTWRMFYDHFSAEHFGAAASPDGWNWHDVSAAIQFPPGPRHGCVIEIDNGTAAKLREVFG